MPKIPFWIFIVLAALYFSATRIDIMDIDASQYAEISREMMGSDNWLQIYDRGKDYLDKPPFLFWASAVSMKIFGVNNFGYRLPSILLALLSLFATYRLTKLLYDERTGRIAALILGCSQGMFLMTNDVRTDTMLMGWTITAIWLIKEWDLKRKLYYLFLGCVCISFGMMTKGPIALLLPVFCFVSDWILKREWKKFIHPAYLLGLAVIAVLLIPMSIGLYQQFDMHPEKVIDGETGTSGLKFFFWTQSFGRLTGENTWSNNAPFSFLYENMLWSFLPWIILFSASLIISPVELFKQKFLLRPRQEWLSTGGFLLAYIALGSSKYQLPHYIFIAFPLAAIMVAKLLKDFLDGKYRKLFRAMAVTQMFIGVLLLVTGLFTFVYVFKSGALAYITWITGALLWLVIILKSNERQRIIWSGAVAIIIANVFMNLHFYPELLKYQAGCSLGRLIHKMDIPAEKVIIYNFTDPLNCTSFYAQRIIKRADSFPSIVQADYVITGKDGINDLRQRNISFELETQGKCFKVSELTPQFLNPATRPEALRPYYFVRIKP